MMLCIWNKAQNVHPPKCPSTCMVTLGRSMWTINLLFLLGPRLHEVVCMLRVYQTLQDHHRFLRNRNRHIHTRFVGLTGPMQKCMSSSDRNELNGTGGIIVITVSCQVRVWHHGMEIGVGRLHGCGGFRGQGYRPNHQQVGWLD